jgi:glycosyltransferase involved in cell wall biosynthesis
MGRQGYSRSLMRLAFLTPLPPAASGIADYSADVLALLAPRHEIDVFHDQEAVDRGRLPASCGVHRAESFTTRHRERPYLAIYQMGNAPDHAFLYPLLGRVPGLLVLHDLVLHHSRARTFLESPEALAYARDPSSIVLRDAARRTIAGYEAEIAYSYPAQVGRLAETHLGTVGSLLPYAYPLCRLPVEASRLTAVHNAYMAAAIRDEAPGAEAVRIAMPVVGTRVAPDTVAALRQRYGLRPDDLVVGCFGLMTREKGIETVARALARAAAALPRLRLLLVGQVPDRAFLARRLDALGVRARAIVAGRVPWDELPAHIEAADLVVHLRYPTARETSAALLRVLAQGRPTILSDLEHLGEIPSDAVVRADLADEEGAVTRGILRLGERPEARARLGAAAAAFVAREHSAGRCLADYEAAITLAQARPDPAPGNGPAHWLGQADGRMPA